MPLYLSFEFNPIHLTLDQDEFPQSRVLRTFTEMEEQEGSVEATLTRIVERFLLAVTNPPSTNKPILSPLLNCVGEAMETEGIPRPLPEYRREVKFDVVHDDHLHHSSYRASVHRYAAQAVFCDDGDIGDDELEDWMLDDENDETEDEDLRIVGDDFEDYMMEDEYDEEEDGEDDDGDFEDWIMEDEYDEEDREDDGKTVDLEGCLKEVRVEIEVDCGVCLDEIPTGIEAEAMGCGHIYHGGCIRKWLRQTKTAAACALCRFPAAGL